MQTVAQYGEDRAFEDFQNLLDAHNRNLMDMQDDLVERTTERLARYGSGVSMSMEEHDENGFARPQRVRAGSMVGFPLRSYLGTLQWNRKYFLSATVAEFAAQITSMFTADIVNVGVQIKTALFTGTNYGWNDYLVDNLGRTLGSGVYLPVKALVNADSGEIPVGPNGETFNPATHTHYLGSTSGTDASAADLTSLVTTVVEHYAGGSPVIYCNRAQEALLRTLTGFTAYLDARIVGATSAAQAPGTPLIPTNIYNRAIGIFDGAEVWVKPWIPAQYYFCFVQGQPKPCRLRERTAGSGILTLTAEDEKYPLRARHYEREFGVGIWHRTNGAVLQGSSTTYTAPTITIIIG
jgi:hypothetical protein